MRAAEFLTEELVGIIHFNRLNVEIHDHAIQRTREPGRNVFYKQVDPVIKKLPSIRKKIKRTIPSGQEFYVYDAAANVSFGMRRLDNINDTVVVALNTVMGWAPYDQGLNSIIEV